MTWPTHSAIAISTLWVIFWVEPELARQNAPLLIICATLGGLLPDLDAPDSKLQRLSLPYGNLSPFRLLSYWVRRTSTHRGWLHSPQGLLFNSTIFLFLLPYLLGLSGVASYLATWLVFTMGYATHILADMATPTGIRLSSSRPRSHLLPYSWTISTASPAEEVVFAIFVGVLLPLLFQLMLWPLQ